MRTETWYYCDHGCGYKTQDKDEMSRHEAICQGEHQAYGAGVLILELKYNPVAGITMFVHDSRHIQARRPDPRKDDIRDFHSVRRTETEDRTLDGCPVQTVTLSTCADNNQASIEFAKGRLCAQFKKEALALCEQWVGIVENDIAELDKEVTMPGVSIQP